MARSYRIVKHSFKLNPTVYIVEENIVIGIKPCFPVKEIEKWIPASSIEFKTIEEAERYIDRKHPNISVIKTIKYE